MQGAASYVGGARAGKAQSASMQALRDEMLTSRRSTTLHILFGIVATLVTILVNCIAVTYFVGTSRWCKEVVLAYGLELEYLVRSMKLKRSCFAWSMLGAFPALGRAALEARE